MISIYTNVQKQTMSQLANVMQNERGTTNNHTILYYDLLKNSSI